MILDGFDVFIEFSRLVFLNELDNLFLSDSKSRVVFLLSGL